MAEGARGCDLEGYAPNTWFCRQDNLFSRTLESLLTYCEVALPSVGCSVRCSVRKRLQSTFLLSSAQTFFNSGSSPLLQHPGSASAFEKHSTTVTALSAAHNYARPRKYRPQSPARCTRRRPSTSAHCRTTRLEVRRETATTRVSLQHQHQHQHPQCPRSSPPRRPLARPWSSWPTS